MNIYEQQNYSPSNSIMLEESSRKIDRDTTVIDFLRVHQEGFDELLFTPIDSLVLSTLVYLNMEVYRYDDIYGITPVPFFDILRFSPLEELTSKSWMKDVGYIDTFLQAVACSRRYKDLSVMLYFNEYSDVIEKQFCAVTFRITPSLYYVAYRGTDGSFAGWKEDFNLSYRDVIPSQMTAQRYLSGALSALPLCSEIYIGGHSKGGNLAEFAALTVNDSQFHRIDGIYNHDGPSFLHEPSPRISTEEFLQKHHKTVPESSIFGMILEDRDQYKVVKSTASLIFQHMPLTWKTDDVDFDYQDGLNKSAEFFDETLDVWLKNSTKEQRECFIDTFYELFTSTPANNWKEFQEGLLKNASAFLHNSSKLDDSTKEIIRHTIKNLGSLASQHAREKISLMLTNKVNKVARSYEIPHQ